MCPPPSTFRRSLPCNLDLEKQICITDAKNLSAWMAFLVEEALVKACVARFLENIPNLFKLDTDEFYRLKKRSQEEGKKLIVMLQPKEVIEEFNKEIWQNFDLYDKLQNKCIIWKAHVEVDADINSAMMTYQKLGLNIPHVHGVFHLPQDNDIVHYLAGVKDSKVVLSFIQEILQLAVNLPAAASDGPNANRQDLFPQGLPNVGAHAGAGNLDCLQNNPQFQVLRTMVQANPRSLQPLLLNLQKQNPGMMRLIQEHQADFLRLINEPVEGGGCGNLFLDHVGSAAMPQAVTLTPEKREDSTDSV